MSLKQVLLISAAIMISTFQGLSAADVEPSSVEIRREEFLLKQRLKPILQEVIKEQYLGLAVNFRYVLLHDPIVSEKTNVARLKLPGFGTQVTITSNPNDIAGYIDKYVRYRTVIVITKTKLPEAIEESIGRLLKQNEDLDIGGYDELNYLALKEETDGTIAFEPDAKATANQEQQAAAEEAKKDKVDELVKKLDKDRKETKDRLTRLFPELETPIKSIDPRQEAESSKHLILSKKAYYNNDLNAALNEVIEAININPYASKSYEMLGSIYYRLKWYNLALNNWEKALALDPENSKLNKFIEKAKREL
jgi:hypothetical protein